MRNRAIFAAIGFAALIALAVPIVPRFIDVLALRVGKADAGVVSFELADAPAGRTSEIRVALWLRAHQRELVASEARFHVDRRAIAAAIAYEAIADPRTGAFGYAARFSGAGKVHYREFRLSEGNPASKQAEDAGLMPRRGILERRDALVQPRIAIDYIGAIMSLFVKRGGHPDDACDIAALTTLYTSMLPSEYAGRAVVENVAGRWAARHVEYLSNAVGVPDERLCRSSNVG